MERKEPIAPAGTPTWTLTPPAGDEAIVRGLEDEHEHATERALEVLRARDPDDPRSETADDTRIPADRMFFKIGEVSEITGIKPYVLRYWEVEFPWIKPEKTSSRQRRYRRQDIALLLQISRLRYEEQLTIERTRQVIRDARTKDTKSGRTRGQKRISDAKQLPLTKIDLAPESANETSKREVHRALGEMRKTVLELLESVEE